MPINFVFKLFLAHHYIVYSMCACYMDASFKELKYMAQTADRNARKR